MPNILKDALKCVLSINCTLIFLALLLYAKDLISNRFPHVESSTCTSQPKVKSSSAKGDFQLTGSQARLFLIHKECVEGVTVCVWDCVWSKEIQDFYSISSIGASMDSSVFLTVGVCRESVWNLTNVNLLCLSIMSINFQPLVWNCVTAANDLSKHIQTSLYSDIFFFFTSSRGILKHSKVRRDVQFSLLTSRIGEQGTAKENHIFDPVTRPRVCNL